MKPRPKLTDLDVGTDEAGVGGPDEKGVNGLDNPSNEDGVAGELGPSLAAPARLDSVPALDDCSMGKSPK